MRAIRRRRSRADKPGDWTRGERLALGYLSAFGALWFLFWGLAALAGVYGVLFAGRFLPGIVLIVFGLSMIAQGRYLLALNRRLARRARHRRLRQAAKTCREGHANGAPDAEA